MVFSLKKLILKYFSKSLFMKDATTMLVNHFSLDFIIGNLLFTAIVTVIGNVVR